MPTWPATLPQQLVGTSDMFDDPNIRTSMDTGPGTVRRRTPSPTNDVSVPMILRGSQRKIFDDFFITDLKHGSLSFDWEDPVEDTTVTFRFKKPVKWSMTRGGTLSTTTTGSRVWSGKLDLEILP